jgi:hypothetical protein
MGVNIKTAERVKANAKNNKKYFVFFAKKFLNSIKK